MHAGSTPVIAGDSVIHIDSNGTLFCHALADGALRWQRDITSGHDLDLGKPIRSRSYRFGVIQTPLIINQQVIVSVYAIGTGVVSVDLDTGKDLWHAPYIGQGTFTYLDPTLLTIDGQPTIVVGANVDGSWKPPALFTGLDPATGTHRWQITTTGP